MKAFSFFETSGLDLSAAQAKRAAATVVCVRGPVGCGKTALLEATARTLAPGMRVGVLLANSQVPEDARRLSAAGAEVIGTLDADASDHHVRAAIERTKSFPLDLLLVESARAAEVEGAVGVAIFSVSGGDDKPVKYPEMVRDAQIVLLNKIDLLPHVSFNLPRFKEEVNELNPDVGVIELSTRRPDTMRPWIDWLRRRVAFTPRADEARIPDLFIG